MSFVSHWTVIATALGLEIQGPIELALADGRTIRAPVLLKNFGAEKGMLLFEGIFPDFWEVQSTLVDMGYGYSCLGPYRDNEEVDMDVAKEVLADWTWSGPLDQRPEWLAETPPDDPDL